MPSKRRETFVLNGHGGEKVGEAIRSGGFFDGNISYKGGQLWGFPPAKMGIKATKATHMGFLMGI